MNTFEIIYKEQFLALTKFEQVNVVAELTAAAKNGELVSVQAEEQVWGDESEIRLYGVYVKTDEEVADYDRSGGLWMYSDPQRLLSNFA